MCLDPRPESLVRVRPTSPRPSAVPVSPAPVVATARVSAGDRWLTVLADSLDARGWTLVTRAATTC
jgi:hypothetical protein